jgi:hypothetical protein
MSGDLSAWLLEQIAEDERLARAAVDETRKWVMDEEDRTRWIRSSEGDIYQGETNGVVATGPYGHLDEMAGEHIARWDPHRVLAECEAKRRIQGRLQALSEHLRASGQMLPDATTADLLDGITGELALPYPDRPELPRPDTP